MAGLIVGLICVLGSSAAAQNTVRLDYVRTPGAATCPDANTLRAFVVGRLGNDPFVEDGAWSLRVLVRPRESGFEAGLELIDPTGTLVGERSVASEGERCEDLVEALSLTLSVVLETVHDAAPAISAEPAQPVEMVVVVSRMPDSGLLLAQPAPAPIPIPPQTPDARPPRPTWRIGGGALVGRGELPRTDVAFGLVAAVRVRSGSALLALDVALPRDTDRIVTGGYAHLGLVRATVGGCGHVAIVGLCGVAALRGYFGVGRDVADSATDFQVGIGVGGRVEVDLIHRAAFVLLARAELVAATRRADAILESTRVWTEPPWSGHGGLVAALELR